MFTPALTYLRAIKLYFSVNSRKVLLKIAYVFSKKKYFLFDNRWAWPGAWGMAKGRPHCALRQRNLRTQQLYFYSGEIVHRKRNLSETLFKREEFFKKTPSLRALVWPWTWAENILKTKLFENDDVTIHVFKIPRSSSGVDGKLC